MSKVSCLWLALTAPCVAFAGCSWEARGVEVHVLADFCDVREPVAISDTVLRSLTARVTDEDVERLGPRIGHVPVAVLRPHSPGAVQGSAANFARTTISGERLADAVSDIPRIILETPYWTGIFRQLGAEGGGEIFVATNLLYKVYRYGGQGQPLDSVWVPPPSWRQAREPVFGEFPPSRREAWSKYLDSISVLKALAVVADTVLVVSVGSYAEEGVSSAHRADELLEVYVEGRMTGTDLLPPGQLVAYSPSSLFFLNRSAEPSGSTVTECVWRGGRR